MATLFVFSWSVNPWENVSEEEKKEQLETLKSLSVPVKEKTPEEMKADLELLESLSAKEKK